MNRSSGTAETDAKALVEKLCNLIATFKNSDDWKARESEAREELETAIFRMLIGKTA